MSKFIVELRNFEKPAQYRGKKSKRYSVTYNGKIYDNKKNHKECHQNKDKRNGYMYYTFFDNPKDTELQGTKRVHRIIAETFIPNPAQFLVVNHLDNNRDNNRVDNLEWTTQSENLKYAAKQGRVYFTSGEDCHLTKYSDDEIRKVCELLQAGYRNKDIAKMTNVPKSYISDIRNREWRKDISKDYEWETISFKDRRGSKAAGAVIDEDIAKKICKLIQKGYGNKEIADKLDCKWWHVRNIRSRKNWVHVSKYYKW